MRTQSMQTAIVAASVVGHASAFSGGGFGCRGGVCSGVDRRRERAPNSAAAPTSGKPFGAASASASATVLCLSSPSAAASGGDFASGRGSAESGGESGDDQFANAPPPSTFREAEVMGLRLMQDGKHEEALRAFQQAMKLPGSRPDFIRKANIAGPSPVGGAAGGTEGRAVNKLDEFEYQAAHYNVACAYACIGNVGESAANLKKSFDYGFDNYAAVKADPDLSNVQSTKEFTKLMDKYDPPKFNPFEVFGKR